MKKENWLTLAALVTMCVFAVLAAPLIREKQENTEIVQIEMPENLPPQGVDIPSEAETPDSGTEAEVIPETGGVCVEENTGGNAGKNTEENAEKMTESMEDALFIGDSRTLGIMEYAGLNEADFFCSTGMSVFNVRKEQVSVSEVGKVSLEELLAKKTYGKIYIMLGINELGYNFSSIVSRYGELLEWLKNVQPGVTLFVQANLHVSKARSGRDSYINNDTINLLNGELSKFADNDKVFYLDANALFDDAQGNLSSNKTADNAHLYGIYYVEWGNWLREETVRCSKLR